MKIEGVPEGWEIVRFAKPEKGEYFLDEYRMPVQSGTDYFLHPKPIVRKVERPKQYRPFASAEEFKPHRDKWWTRRSDSHTTTHPPAAYNDASHGGLPWDEAFKVRTFEDGSFFGVEVSE
jgi:hypothetical protein